MQVTLDRQQGANAWLTIGIREGRNREIRRAMQEIGLTVNRLIRISYGPFQLGELKAGAVEEVRRRILRDQLGLAPSESAPNRKDGSARTTVKRKRSPHKRKDAPKPK
jgi:23S rRNA pseudouridine2605 synthase